MGRRLPRMIDRTTPTTNANRKVLHIAKSPPMIIPPVLWGTTSPYPTVESVASEYHIAWAKVMP